MGCVTVLHCDRFLSLSFFQIALTTGVTRKQVSRAGYFTDSFHHSQSAIDGVLNLSWWKNGSIKASGKLPTFPSPNPTFCPKWEVTVNADLGEGYVGSFLDVTIQMKPVLSVAVLSYDTIPFACYNMKLENSGILTFATFAGSKRVESLRYRFSQG